MRRLTSAALIASLSACSMVPNYQRPASPVPASWPVGDAYLQQSEASLPAITYRDMFKDARLQRIIESALSNNRNLRAAFANIAAAREQYRIQRANILPDVNTNAGVTRSDNGSNTQQGAGQQTRYTVQGGISAFEIDLFGRIRALNEAAQDRYFATEAGARATRLSLVNDIANAWLNHAADKDLLAIAEQTVVSAQRSVDLTRARLTGGIAPRTDLRQAEQTLEQARADAAQAKTDLAQDINLLQLLVGAPIDSTLLPASIAEVEPTISALPAGLDSTILLRRPDVVQAEYQLRAANAEIGAARAALFPRISLTALLGFASTALSDLFAGGNFNWSVSPQASYSIFQGGAAKANVRLSQAQRDVALAQYEGAIQTAFREVSDALARRGTIDEQLRAQRAFLTAAQDNYTLSDARYRGGIDPFLSALVAQRSLYTAQRTLVGTRLAKAQNLVQLYTTLGGDSLLDATANGPVAASSAR